MAFTQIGKMFKAIQKNDVKTVTRLLESGYDISDSKWSGACAMLNAVHGGRTEIVDLLIRHGGDFSSQYINDDMTGGTWMTLLHVAAARGHKDIVDMLLEADKYDHALLNKMDGSRNTALHHAAAGGHADIVRTLLDHGFDPAQKGANDKLAIGYAFQGKHQTVVDMLSVRQKPAPKSVESAPVAPPALKPAALDGWTLVDPQCVVRVSVLEDAGYKIAEVFNFASRERIRIVNNLKTKADHVATTAFDELPDKGQLDDAYQSLLRLGGKAEPPASGAKPAVKPARLAPPGGQT